MKPVAYLVLATTTLAFGGNAAAEARTRYLERFPEATGERQLGLAMISAIDDGFGRKGMLTDGGIRVPFVASWMGRLPAGQVYGHPVSSLDIAATALAAAAIRKGRWKRLKLSTERDFLFDMESREGESRDVDDEHPELAVALDAELREWASQLASKGLPEVTNPKDRAAFDRYLGR